MFLKMNKKKIVYKNKVLAEKWYKNGKYHREDGPAIEWADGSKEWWVNGELKKIVLEKYLGKKLPKCIDGSDVLKDAYKNIPIDICDYCKKPKRATEICYVREQLMFRSWYVMIRGIHPRNRTIGCSCDEPT